MKNLLIVCMLFAGMSTLKAQPAMGHNKWEENDNEKRGIIQQDNEYANTEMNLSDKRITFSDLPDLKRGTMAVITNTEGEVLSQRRVDPANNSMDIHWLQKGQLYFVTLVYKSKSKKGFTLRI